MKHKCILHLDTYPLPKISHSKHAIIPKSENNPKSQTLLVPTISNKGQSFYKPNSG